ncbi:MAG: hypothetical protein ACWA41_07595 [Putridiphycobacter sp.]
MNKYFIEILKNRTLLIIPKFGALTVANRASGKIVFNPNLTFDDSVLSDYISEKEGMDKTEAKNQIAKFVREIEAQLGKGESYDIYQFGKFFKNEKGEVVFEAEAINIEKAKVEKPVVEELTPKKEEVKEEKKDESKGNIYIPPVEKEIKDKVEEKVEKVEEKSEEKKVTQDDLKNKYKKSNASKSKDKTKQKKETKPKEKGEKKKRKVLPWLIILLLLIGGGTAGYFYQNEIKTMLGMTGDDGHEAEESSEETQDSEVNSETTDQNEELVDVEANDSISNEEEVAVIENQEDIEEVVEEIVEEAIEAETTKEEPVSTVASSVNGSYHIIAGAFGEESNAVKFAEKNSGKVLGKFNGLYQVALKSYDTRADASEGLKSFSSEFPSAWILKYEK